MLKNLYASLNYINLINVDELSRLKDKTLNKRKAEVPKAKAIITAIINEFYDWYKMRSQCAYVESVKSYFKRNSFFIII